MKGLQDKSTKSKKIIAPVFHRVKSYYQTTVSVGLTLLVESLVFASFSASLISRK